MQSCFIEFMRCLITGLFKSHMLKLIQVVIEKHVSGSNI
jgi:hypothetical protein